MPKNRNLQAAVPPSLQPVVLQKALQLFCWPFPVRHDHRGTPFDVHFMVNQTPASPYIFPPSRISNFDWQFCYTWDDIVQRKDVSDECLITGTDPSVVGG